MKILRVNNFTCVLHNVTCFHLGVHLHSLTTTVTSLQLDNYVLTTNDNTTNPQTRHRRNDNDEGTWGWWGKKWAQGRVYKGMPAFLSFIVLLLTLLYLPHRHNERGETPSHCVLFHTDTTRGETPFHLVLFIQMWWEGVLGNPFPPCFVHTDVMRRSFPLPAVLPSTQTQQEGGNPFLLCFCPQEVVPPSRFFLYKWTQWEGEIPHPPSNCLCPPIINNFKLLCKLY